MNEPLLDRLIRRDRAIALAALVLIASLAWLYVLMMAQGMPATSATPPMDMPGMDMAAPAPEVWDLTRFFTTFAMWVLMMTAMMLPAAAPVILLYARVARSAAAQGKVFAPTAWFLLGYLTAWTGFSLLAAGSQYYLARMALIDATLAVSAPALGAYVLIAAGVYQWTPMKDACLSKCRSPMAFVQAHGGFRPAASQSMRLGVLHGLYCIGCCWLLMALLFVGGVMSLLWIAGLAVLVLAEKTLPGGLWIARVGGLAIAGLGVWMLWAH